MSIFVTVLALVSSAPATPATSPSMDHPQHQQMAQQHDSKTCACCKDVASKDAKMACCDKHKQAGDEHSAHSAQK